MVMAAALFVMALLGVAAGAPSVSASPEPPEPPVASARTCLRCHAMSTLGYRDPQSGEIIELFIAPQALAHSTHGELACSECHGQRYRDYPHPDPDPAADGMRGCVRCHEDDETGSSYRLDRIQAEFEQSVHVTAVESPRDRPVGCESCHDPHRFRPAQVGDPIEQIVGEHNRVCLSCHETIRDPRLASHAWLPNPERHWQAVRCIDCHTTGLGEASHQILPADQAARHCVGCHSRSAELLNRLYDYRSEEELARHGWLSKAVFNEAYVVGLSRNPALDRLSLIVLGLVALALAAHGAGRYLASRRGRDPS